MTNSSLTSAQRLKTLSEQCSVLICLGAGGVGKTTTAASIAISAALSGRTVACITIDPAQRLADSLGVSDFPQTESLLDITHSLKDINHKSGKLFVGVLSANETFQNFIRDRISHSHKTQRILNNAFYKNISKSLSGLQEYAALQKLYELRNDSNIDLIILDTPPTSNALDFFTAPRRLLDALNGPFIRMLKTAYNKTSPIGFDFLGRSAAKLINAVSTTTESQILKEMMGFIDAMSDIFVNVSHSVTEVENALYGPEVLFCLVTTPDKATVQEVSAYQKKLQQIGFSVNAIIFNKTHTPRISAPVPMKLKMSDREKIETANRQWNDIYEQEMLTITNYKKAWKQLKSVEIVPIIKDDTDHLKVLLEMAKFL